MNLFFRLLKEKQTFQHESVLFLSFDVRYSFLCIREKYFFQNKSMYFHPRMLSRILFPMIISLIVLLIVFSKTREDLQQKSFPNISSRKTKDFYRMLKNPEDERTSLDGYSIWCLNMANRFDSELSLPQSPILRSPLVNSSTLQRFPYRYSLWKSSPNILRLMSPCEHNLAMRLLMIIERICRKHRIPYMLTDGSLLGSWRHHDIIPWDDDIDLMIPLEDKERFKESMSSINETLVEYYIISNKKRQNQYYKIYFKKTPSAGSYSWNFPFVDLFFYEQNQTHLWQMGYPESIRQVNDTFPLMMRPFGELWFPTPRRPEKFFSFDPYDDCKSHFWDHKKETGQREITVKCADLKEIYPFVERDNQSNTTEVLKINDTIIHTIIFD